jgi:DNA-binding CsgD family transcriptional regulator
MNKRIVLFFLLLSNFLFGKTQSNEDRIVSLFEYVDLNSEFNINNSLDSLNFALSLSRKYNLKSLEVESLRRLSRLMLTKFSNYEEAYRFVNEIKSIADLNKGEIEYKAIYHNSLGSIYFYENTNREKAFSEFNKSLDIYREHKINQDPVLLNNYALALMENGNIDESLELFHLARKTILEKDRVAKFYDLLIKNSINLGILNYPDSSEYYFKDAIVLSENTLEKSDDMIANIYLAVFYQEQNFNKEALIYFQTALNYDAKYVPISLIVTLYKGLAELYVNMDDYKMAYKYELIAKNYLDSLAKMGIDMQLVSMEYKTKVDAIKYQQNIDKLKLLQAKERLTKQITFFVSLILFILLITVFWLYKLNKARQFAKIKAERDLFEKETKIQNAELEILRKNELLISANFEISVREKELNVLKNSLQNHLNERYDPEFDELRKFLSQLKLSEKKSNQLNRLNSIISLTNNEFYNRVRLKHSNLTEEEIRLITLIRLNLGTDDLLMIFNISKSSLNTKRYRVRKKIGLPNKKSLEDYVMNL